MYIAAITEIKFEECEAVGGQIRSTRKIAAIEI